MAGTAYNVAETCMLVNMALTRGECASWVQAWGSIGAIAIAIGVAFVQHWQNLKRQREIEASQRAQAVAGPLALAEKIASFLEAIAKMLHSNGARETFKRHGHAEEPSRMLAEYRALPLYKLPSYELMHEAYAIGNSIHAITMLVNESIEALATGGSVHANNHSQLMFEGIAALKGHIERFKAAELKPDTSRSENRERD